MPFYDGDDNPAHQMRRFADYAKGPKGRRTEYHLYADPGDVTPTTLRYSGTVPIWLPTTDLALGTWSYQWIALDPDDGTNNTIAAKALVTVADPAELHYAPDLVDTPTPAEGATNQSASGVNLTWVAPPDADTYDVHLSTDAADVVSRTAGSKILDNSSSTSVSTGALTPGATYYWSVVARNAGGDIASAVWMFTVEIGPSVTPVIAPTIAVRAPVATVTAGAVATQVAAPTIAVRSSQATVTTGAALTSVTAPTIALRAGLATIAVGQATTQVTAPTIAVRAPQLTVSTGAVATQVAPPTIAVRAGVASVAVGQVTTQVAAPTTAVRAPQATVSVGPVTTQVTPPTIAVRASQATVTAGESTTQVVPPTIAVRAPLATVAVGQVATAVLAPTIAVRAPSATVSVAGQVLTSVNPPACAVRAPVATVTVGQVSAAVAAPTIAVRVPLLTVTAGAPGQTTIVLSPTIAVRAAGATVSVGGATTTVSPPTIAVRVPQIGVARESTGGGTTPPAPATEPRLVIADPGTSTELTFRQDPSAHLDYTIDWVRCLEGGDAIASSTWSIAGDVLGVLEMANDSRLGTRTTVWLTGGLDGQAYKLVNHMRTNDGREFDRTFFLRVEER